MATVRIDKEIELTGIQDMIGTGASGYAPNGQPNKPVYFNTTLKSEICVLDDDRVFIRINSGNASKGGLNYAHSTWKLHFYFSNKSFDIAQDANHIYSSNVNGVPADTLSVGDDNVHLTGPSFSDSAVANWSWSRENGNPVRPAVGSQQTKESLEAMGFKHKFNLDQLNEVEIDGVKYKGYYICGFVDIISAPEDTVTVHAGFFSFDASVAPEFFDYFPWERRLNNEWKSLNRNENNAGLYRKINGNWAEMKNGGDTNHGFRREQGAWKVSPKSGQGA